MSDSQEWYWDLNKKRAVPASERGVSDNTLGPYPTKGEAENWRSKLEQRNDDWDEADEEWSDPRPRPDP